MTRSGSRLAATALIGLLLGCPTPEPEPVEEPPAPLPSDGVGPYDVGITTFREFDASGKLMTIEVWYPARPEAGDELDGYEEIDLVRDGYREAPQDLRGAPYPLVVFSHGFGGIRFQSSYLVSWLASHGMVVAGVDHVGNTMFDLDADDSARVAVERPGDVRFAADLVGDKLGHLATPDDGYAMVGHSFGGWTTLVVTGGVLDLDALSAHCDAIDSPGCGFLDGQELAGFDLSETVPDPRARVGVALAPGIAYSFGVDGAGLGSNVPTLVQGGTRDGDMPYEEEIRPVYEALPAGSALATFDSSAHFGFSDLCAIAPLDECEGEAEGFMEIDRVHQLSRTLTTAWIRARWLGEQSEEVFLGVESWQDADDLGWEDAAGR
jgi:predicted dienelactone hydrolase